MYRERRLARFFQNPGQPSDSVLRVGSTGLACRNVRIALRYLGFDLCESDIYDEKVSECIRRLQERERHKNIDDLTGPGTRALIVRTLMRESGERIFSLMTFPKGDPFPLVFVSYAREDRRVAEDVVNFLVGEGVEVWVDYRNLQPGQKWALAIQKAIPAARYFLALISKYTLSKKGYVQKEVKTAWDVAERYPEAEIFVIPARLEECEVQDSKFAELHWIDLFPDPKEGLRQILEFLVQAD
jgi:hypothetical protein